LVTAPRRSVVAAASSETVEIPVFPLGLVAIPGGEGARTPR
jgi:hypothetical protein